MWLIREKIPVGFEHNKDPQDNNLMPELPFWIVINNEYSSALKQLWTLWWGNHFIEIQKWDDWYIWIMIHSWSRNLWKKVADYYNKLATELNERWHSYKGKELAFLPLDSVEWKE